jgi:hypothetical protein
MGFDLSVRFADTSWYHRNRERVAQMARALPSAIGQSPSAEEIWLKDPTSTTTWAYEVRILLKEHALDVEVMGFSSVFHRDVRAFVARISSETRAELIDDDGEPV